MKKIIVSLILTLLPMVASADVVEINGVWYNLIPKGNIAEVTCNPSGEKYSGDLKIEGKITVDNTVYIVEKISKSAFISCEKLTSLAIPNTVKTVDEYAFNNCNNLNAVYINDLEAWCNISFGSNPLQYAQKLYENDKEIIDLVIPNTVTSIGNGAFNGYKNLLSVTFPSSLISIGDHAFQDCKKLTSLSFPIKLTSIGIAAFSGCTNLSSLIIPPNLNTIGGDAFLDCFALTSVHISDLEAWCNITFENSLVYKASNPLKYAHHLILNGSEIKHLVIPNSLSYIHSRTFIGCSDIVSVDIPNNVTSIGDEAFCNCSGLQLVNIPNSVESIGKWAFGSCSSLTSATIPNSVKTIGDYAFCGCSNIKSLEISKNVYSIGSNAFEDCASLSTVYLPTGLIEIKESLFMNCYSLKNLIISEGVKTIGKSAFQGCKSLESITIPNGVTSIDNYAFSGCADIKTISIPNSMQKIGLEAFAKCEKLTDVYCKAEEPTNDKYDRYRFYTAADAFKDSYQDYITLHVPEASINSYKYYNPWKYFKEIVALTNEDKPELLKCSTPEISYENGTITFTCETEGVEFLSEINVNDVKKYNDSSIKLTQIYKVSVYATKIGYEDSEMNTREFMITVNRNNYISGDANNDQLVNVADIVAITNIIKEGNASAMSPKCDTPTVCYSDGKIEFGCKTEGVEYVSEVKNGDMKKYNVAEITLSQIYEVSIYAQKAGYENSEVVTREIIITGNGKAIVVGDANGDGKVDAADIVTTTNMIIEKQ